MEYTVEVNEVGTFWYQKGTKVLHREDGPAAEFANGSKFWYQNGKRHREDGPAIEYVNGDKYWFQNDKLHREDGPAIEIPNGTKYWYLNGTKVWYLNGERVNQKTDIRTILIEVQNTIQRFQSEIQELIDRHST